MIRLLTLIRTNWLVFTSTSNTKLSRSSGFGLLGFLSWAFRATLLRQQITRKQLAYLLDEVLIARNLRGPDILPPHQAGPIIGALEL